MAIPKIAPDEEFRPVNIKGGFYADKYLISNYGRVINLSWKQSGKTREMATRLNRAGYPYLTLSFRARRHCDVVHKIVAMAFLPPCPGEYGVGKNKWQINHIDGVRHNAKWTNLEWVTPRQNIRDYHEKGRANNLIGEDHGMAKLSEYDAQAIIEAYHSREMNQRQLAEFYGVTQPAISLLLRGINWSHMGDRPPIEPIRVVSSEDMHAIQQRYSLGGITQRELAAEYGVSQSHISTIINKDR